MSTWNGQFIGFTKYSAFSAFIGGYMFSRNFSRWPEVCNRIDWARW